ncbi:3-phosphoshikimate 1-carboxyvinyltransferase [uncultured Thermanaerothrix sp.]|uniref:3-phosphoshikimate 1-carboxyvinyltransferase n=1 Tax=uncultured Thermanaerothrix sp. TaxID=1195149 RepID=UPI002612D2F3|nr:3-phosphoshikimate 1-carboxyvinyltransferase [uncultured Thermanaerothrix sp.]
MSAIRVLPCSGLQGSATIPGDKSISHRALLLGALAHGSTTVYNFLPGGDCLATAGALRALGIHIETPSDHTVIIQGNGLHGFRPSRSPINCVRSGTTMRLLTGLLAGQPFSSVLTGEDQLLRRPMERVAIPLRQMGAEIHTTNGRAPLFIQGRNLHGAHLTLDVPSAQVKSAVLLAALYADSSTTIYETAPTRDHTERMLQAMGVALEVRAINGGREITLSSSQQALAPLEIEVPGDFSSAAFPLVAALIVPGSHIHLKSIGINPTRTGLLDVLEHMGANIRIHNERRVANEPVAELEVQTGQLKAAEVSGDLVVRMIDEFPIFAIAATQAHGKTVVRDAAELRVKETDRIATVVTELRKLGANIVERPDGFEITGPVKLQGTTVSSHGDHRLAMALFVAGLIAHDPVMIDDIGCATDSFPGFLEIMRSLGAQYDPN